LENNSFDLLNLYKLQLSDSRISFLEREIEKLKANEELKTREEEFKECEEKYDDLKKQYHELDKERKRLDDDLNIRNEKIKKNEQKLSSGMLTSSKEIMNFQEEIVSIRKSNESMEDSIIEIMIKIDDINELIRLENEKKEKIKSHIDNLKEEINKNVASIEEKLKSYIVKKEETIKLIPQDLFAKYGEVKEKRGGIAVGILKDRLCMACNMEMSSGEAMKMDNSGEIYKCPTCKRMIIKYREEVDLINEEYSI
jgi:uncharacterized protein